jgi:ACR3 family arsenite efflux pump ArsB
MITYKLHNEYHARLQVGLGMDRQVYTATGNTRSLAIALAIAKYENNEKRVKS